MAKKTPIATRMALLATKKKIKLAKKGHKLLKEKRDALISEFFKIIDELKALRSRMEDEIKDAFRSLILAQAVSGISDIKRAADTSKAIDEVRMKFRTIMGLKVPVFDWKAIETKVTEKGYSLAGTTIELDNASKKFEIVLNTLVKMAEYEATVKSLAEEIKKTKRKVNALERILIPNLEEDKVYITMRLEEMERETFGRLKIVKAKITS